LWGKGGHKEQIPPWKKNPEKGKSAKGSEGVKKKKKRGRCKKLRRVKFELGPN